MYSYRISQTNNFRLNKTQVPSSTRKCKSKLSGHAIIPQTKKNIAHFGAAPVRASTQGGLPYLK